MLLDELMPTFHFNEIHRVTVKASPEKTMAAVKALKPTELAPIVNLLLEIRNVPARLAGKHGMKLEGNQSMLEVMCANGFVPLGESANEIVPGLIGQFWKLTPATQPHIQNRQEFDAFDDASCAKVATNFKVDAISPGQVICSTETRIYAADPNTHKRFAVYWFVISMGSGLIRILWLRAIKRRAERRE